MNSRNRTEHRGKRLEAGKKRRRDRVLVVAKVKQGRRKLMERGRYIGQCKREAKREKKRIHRVTYYRGRIITYKLTC